MQILVITYRLVVHYGVPVGSFVADCLSTFYESHKIHAIARIVSDYSFEHSHWNGDKSLGDWLKEEKVVGIYGVDTRELTKILREKGSMKGKIVFDKEDVIDFEDPNLVNQVAVVSCKDVTRYGEGNKKVVLVDCGVKDTINRGLLKSGGEVIRVHWEVCFIRL